MKSYVDEIKSCKPFPKLMKYEDEDVSYIVLFTDDHNGTIVHVNYDNDNSGFKVGESSDLWIIEEFNDFSGKVTLSSSDAYK